MIGGQGDVTVLGPRRQHGVGTDCDRPPPLPAAGCRRQEPFDEPGVCGGWIMEPEDDQIGPVAEFLPGGRHLADPRDRRPCRLRRLHQARVDRRPE
jgi:hypothetical protein